MKKILILSTILVCVIAGCKKPNLADNSSTGEGLVPFSLKTPTSGTNLVLNAATPTATVDITWNPSTPGLHAVPTYKWIAALKATGNLDNPVISVASGNGGLDSKLTLTYKQLDSVLKVAGIADGAKADLIWSVQADNGSTKIVAQNMFNLSVTRFKDGATPFSILGPSSSSSVLSINPTSTTDNLKFNWTKSNPAVAATGLKYRVYFYKDDAASTPVFSISSNNLGADTLLTMTYKAFSDSLVNHGLTNPSTVANLKWNVSAVSGTWTQWSDYTNQLYIARLVRMYLVGSINGWDINAPFEMVADQASSRLGKIFYTYIKLTTADEFKFVRTPGDWNTAYGNNGASGTGFNTGMNVGGNFQIATAGTYRLTIDIENNKAYVQQKQVGLVGSLQTPSQWDPAVPIFGSIIGRNRFVIISNMSASDEFKFHEGPAWDNSTPDKARWWGKGAAAGTLDVDGNGGNINNATGASRIRAVWDGTDPQQVKYNMYAAAEMRVVGDGIQGVNAWDPPTSPQMTYMGNGKWQITLTLVANKDIKFLGGNDWSIGFDYEDAGTGPTVVGTPRAIRWDGSNNFKTPATTGSYTIVLDEYNQTVTIN
jgi:hypothetical protein